MDLDLMLENMDDLFQLDPPQVVVVCSLCPCWYYPNTTTSTSVGSVSTSSIATTPMHVTTNSHIFPFNVTTGNSSTTTSATRSSRSTTSTGMTSMISNSSLWHTAFLGKRVIPNEQLLQNILVPQNLRYGSKTNSGRVLSLSSRVSGSNHHSSYGTNNSNSGNLEYDHGDDTWVEPNTVHKYSRALKSLKLEFYDEEDPLLITPKNMYHPSTATTIVSPPITPAAATASSTSTNSDASHNNLGFTSYFIANNPLGSKNKQPAPKSFASSLVPELLPTTYHPFGFMVKRNPPGPNRDSSNASTR